MTDSTTDERVAELREMTTDEAVQEWEDVASDIRHDNDFGPTIKILDFNAHCTSGRKIMKALQTERNAALDDAENADQHLFSMTERCKTAIRNCKKARASVEALQGFYGDAENYKWGRKTNIKIAGHYKDCLEMPVLEDGGKLARREQSGGGDHE